MQKHTKKKHTLPTEHESDILENDRVVVLMPHQVLQTRTESRASRQSRKLRVNIRNSLKEAASDGDARI